MSQVTTYGEAMVSAAQRMSTTVWSPSRGSARDLYIDFNQLTFDIAVLALFGEEVAASSQVRMRMCLHICEACNCGIGG